MSFSVASRFNFVVWSILSHSRKISTYVICMTSLFVLVHLEIICLCNAATCLIYTQTSYTNYDNLRQRKPASLCVHNGGSSEVTKQTCLHSNISIFLVFMILRPRVSKLNVNIRKQLKFYCSWKSRDSNDLAIYSWEKAPNAQSN